MNAVGVLMQYHAYGHKDTNSYVYTVMCMGYVS